jgi:hypothetical protein
MTHHISDFNWIFMESKGYSRIPQMFTHVCVCVYVYVYAPLVCIWSWKVGRTEVFSFTKYCVIYILKFLYQGRSETTAQHWLIETMRVYPKVSGLAAWSENCKLYSSLPLGAVVLLFCESAFAAITLCVASQQVLIVVISLLSQSGNFWIHPHILFIYT